MILIPNHALNSTLRLLIRYLTNPIFLGCKKRVTWTTDLQRRYVNNATHELYLISNTQIDPTTDPWSPRNLMHIPIRNLLRVKKDISCDLTLGDAVQEIFLHLQPSLASTIKEVLMENTSSHYMSSIDETLSMASENLISDDPHDSSLVQLNYGVDEEMKEMKKILDNPWNTDETIDLARLQIETMDSWKKDFGRLNKILEEKKEIQSVEDAWDDAVPNQNSGAISTNQTSQVQPNSPVQAKRIETILTPKKNQATSRKLFRIWIFSSFITILIIASMMIFVVLELDYYKSHTAEAMWIERHNRFFLSSTFV